MTLTSFLVGLGGLTCVSVIGGLVMGAVAYVRKSAGSASAANSANSTFPNPYAPAGPPAPPIAVKPQADGATIAIDPPGPRKQTVSRTFDAWDVGKTEEMLVVCLMGEGKEQEAIDLLQLRIKRKKSQDQVIPVAASA